MIWLALCILGVCIAILIKLIDIMGDTTFSWQMQKEIFFELKRLTELQGKVVDSTHCVNRILIDWDSNGLPHTSKEIV